MSVEGEAEMLANVTRLEVEAPKKARKSINKGAEIFAKHLKDDTPVDSGALASDVKVGAIKSSTGRFEKQVGYGGKSAWRAHFPDKGTKKQRAQNFSIKAQEESRDEILEVYAEEMRLLDD
ncbi:HK97 gp10 family phage protein [Latilactobacillus curvatus]|uniref:HK97-gp10 family putative phage morphogenesis protein n=1 Tax=Latilactobacillus curvatus TaxID=28038 RepID=UPI0020C82FFE|nr:HK97-gp10 family putative phage morphogenesis protein [Latilactobacillus curvatus]MCP8848938.1 HK97 gp10 family phage protein [Latilactobacillus curvatus]